MNSNGKKEDKDITIKDTRLDKNTDLMEYDLVFLKIILCHRLLQGKAIICCVLQYIFVAHLPNIIVYIT